MDFLRSVANAFVKEAGLSELQDYCFIFPNRRSWLFFRKYLSEQAQAPCFVPAFLTIDELFGRLAGLVPLDRISLLYRLYCEYYNYVKVETPESFDEFLYWGEILLADFDDLDRYLVDAQKLFSNIGDLHELEDESFSYMSERQKQALVSFWGNVLKFKDGKKEKNFLSVWKNLHSIYTSFKDSLRADGYGYEGMIYRDAVENFGSNVECFLDRFKRIVFVGFNALNICEEHLFHIIKERYDADFYWDFYGRMIMDPDNRSSFFFNEFKYIEKFPSRYALEGCEVTAEPVFHAYGVPSITGQTRYAGEILSQLASKKDFSAMRTAVVLPDQNMLFPMLSALPESIADVNVTMGYPLSQSNVASLIRALAELQNSWRADDSFYHAPVRSVLQHPFVKCLCVTSNPLEGIVSGNMVRVTAEFFKVYCPALQVIFQRVDTNLPPLPAVASYLEKVFDAVAPGLDETEISFLTAVKGHLRNLAGIEIEIRVDTAFRLLQRSLAMVSIPFTGEPLNGLQVMGPLETRLLDFDRVIILGCNEGVFPSKNVAPSIIPFNVRKGYGMPTYEHQDAIAAYHFYRSICRAKEVYLLYDSRSADLARGEMSRYLSQLEYHHGVDLHRVNVKFPISAPSGKVVSVEKTPEVMEELSKHSFSSSSLTCYLNCPLKFYLSNIALISQSEQVDEAVEYNTFGSIFHKAAELLYREYAGKVLTTADFERMRDGGKLGEIVRESYKLVMKAYPERGQALIVTSLVQTYLEGLIKVDSGLNHLEIKGLEKRFALFDKKLKVSFKGFIDRLDRVNGRERIVDYKTGRLHLMAADTPMESLFNSETAKDFITSFQLLFYYYMLGKENEEFKPQDTDLAVYPLTTIFNKENPFVLHPALNSEQIEDFKSRVESLVGEILDARIPFAQTPYPNNCSYCDFKTICGR